MKLPSEELPSVEIPYPDLQIDENSSSSRISSQVQNPLSSGESDAENKSETENKTEAENKSATEDSGTVSMRNTLL